MYKQASQVKLRYVTIRGEVSTEQLWDITLTDLSQAIKAVQKILKKSDDDDLSFLDESKVVDVANTLRFSILKDVYLTRKEMNKSALAAVEKKAVNQQILSELAKRKEESYSKMTDEELEALLNA